MGNRTYERWKCAGLSQLHLTWTVPILRFSKRPSTSSSGQRQYVTDHAVQGKYVTTSKTTLNDETYDDVREATRLHSNHVQSARNKAGYSITDRY